MAWSIDTDHVIKPEDVKFKFLEEPETVLIKLKAEKKIKGLLKLYPELEWMAGLKGLRKEDGSWVVEDLEIIEQEIQGAFVEATTKGNKELAELKNCIGWIHSHNTMKATFSSTDYETIEMYSVSIVVNNNHNYSAVCLKDVDCEQSNAHGKKVIKKLNIFIESEIIETKQLEKICKKKIKEKEFYSGVNEGVQTSIYEQEIGREDITGQPNFEVLTKNMSGELIDLMSSMKKKLIKKNGINWRCSSCNGLLSKSYKKVSFCFFCSKFVHKRCITEDNEGYSVCDECSRELKERPINEDEEEQKTMFPIQPNYFYGVD